MAVKQKIVAMRKWFDLAAVVLAVVAIIMMFVPAITIYEGTNLEKTFSGLQVIFGYVEKGNYTEFAWFDFSFMNLLTYILFIAGVVVLVLNMFGKSGKFGSFIALGCFVVATVFSFCALGFVVPASDIVKAFIEEGEFVLAAGPIVAGIMGILSSGICAVKIFVK